jgi:hypothetical protein
MWHEGWNSGGTTELQVKTSKESLPTTNSNYYANDIQILTPVLLTSMFLRSNN